MPKMMPPAETIFWVPKEHAATTADLLKPALYAEGTGKAVNISCAVVAGYTLGAAESDTDDTRSICDSGNVKTPTIANYEGELTFFREQLKSDGTPGDTTDLDKAWALFKQGTNPVQEGWLVKRLGLRREEAMKQGQEISAFLFIPDNPRDVTGDGTQPIQFTVSFMPQGQFFLNKSMTA